MIKTFEFARQTTRYTCGPAALCAVGALLGRKFEEHNVARDVKAQDFIGVCNKEMEHWAQQNLPVHSFGENSYHGGLAIANIRNEYSGIGHYVLFLGKRNNTIRYYCPFLGKTVTRHEDDLSWQNSDGSIKKWSINFETDLDFFAIQILPDPHIFFIGEPFKTLCQETDTSLIIKNGYEKQEIKTSWHSTDKILIRGDTLLLSGIPVYEEDIVWVRLDPRNDVKYYAILQQLCHVKGVFMNAPSTVLTCNDKKLANGFRKETDIFSFTSMDTLRTTLRHLKHFGAQKFVIKPVNLFGGQDVVITECEKELEAMAEKLLKQTGCGIIERYIQPTTKKQIDTSIIVTQDVIISSIFREAKDDFSLTTFHKGSLTKPIKKLSPLVSKTIQNFQEIMREKDIFWAGLNFLEDQMIEANITCPGGLQSMNSVYNDHFENLIIKEAKRYKSQKAYESY